MSEFLEGKSDCDKHNAIVLIISALSTESSLDTIASCSSSARSPLPSALLLPFFSSLFALRGCPARRSPWCLVPPCLLFLTVRLFLLPALARRVPYCCPLAPCSSANFCNFGRASGLHSAPSCVFLLLPLPSSLVLVPSALAVFLPRSSSPPPSFLFLFRPSPPSPTDLWIHKCTMHLVSPPKLSPVATLK